MSRSWRKFLAFEALENRSLMATDFAFALRLETLDTQDRPVSKINIGDAFKLRLTAEELNPVLSLDRGIGGYVGMSFDPSLVEKNGAVNYANAYSINRKLDVLAPGVWENLGALPDLFNPEFATPPRPRLQWEIPMIAKAGGEVVFQTNPSDLYGFGFDTAPYAPSAIRFGYARLQIGDPIQYPGSPWRNPQDTGDVDGNGEVNEDDLALIEIILGFRQPPTPYRSPEVVEGIDRGQADEPPGLSDEILSLMALGSQGKIVLDGATVPKNTAPYLDVNGDRVADRLDVLAVKERFLKIPEPEPGELPFAFLFKPDAQLNLSVVNLRTNQPVESNAEVLVGDLIEVRFSSLIELRKSLYEPYAQRVELREDLLQAKSPGTMELRFDVVPDPFGRIAALAGVTPEEFATRMQELIPLTRTIQVRENASRPVAADRTYSYTQLEGIQSAREMAKVLSSPEALRISIDPSQGLLKDVATNEAVKIVVVAGPNAGELQLKDDGSFSYLIYDSLSRLSLYDILKQGDHFSYVLVSPSGTSEIRKVSFSRIVLPLLDLELKAVDAQGNAISSARVGDEFFIEVSAYANYAYRRIPAQFKPAHSLYFDYQFDSQIGRAEGVPVPTDRFNWERLSLGQENGKLVLISEPMFPGFQVQQDEVKVSFDRYSLAVPEIVLFRQKVVGIAPGQFKLNINDARLDLPEVGPDSVNSNSANVEIIAASQITQQRLDVSGNGEITPLDVLLVINHLNLRSSDGEEVAKATAVVNDALDVNQDGIVSPLDALLIINRLNAAANASLQAEGEAEAKIDPSFVIDLDTIESRDIQIRFGAYRKGARLSSNG